MTRSILAASALAFMLTAACGGVPDAWKAVVPAEGLDELLDLGSKEHASAFYPEDMGAEAVRKAFRAKAETAGMTRAYECKYEDGRVADGYIKAPNSLQYTVIPKKGEKIMVMLSQTGNTKAFAAVPDDKACKMVGKK